MQFLSQVLKSLFSKTLSKVLIFFHTKLQSLNAQFFDRYFCIFLLLFSFLVGFLGIDKAGLWGDEAFTAEVVRHNFDRILAISQADTNPPLYYFILHIWTNLFGFSELSVRFPSLIFYCFAILGSFQIAQKVFSKNFVILATVLIISNPIMLYYAQEMRNYSLTICLFIWSFYFLMRIENLIYANFIKFEQNLESLEKELGKNSEQNLDKEKLKFGKNIDKKILKKLENTSKNSLESNLKNNKLVLGQKTKTLIILTENLELLKLLWQDKKLIWTSFGFVLLCLLGLYSQTMFTVILLSFGFLLVLNFLKFGVWKYWRIWLIFWSFLGFWIILGFLPWMRILTDQTNKLSLGFWMPFKPIEDIFQFLAESFSGFNYTKAGFWHFFLYLLVLTNLFLLFNKLLTFHFQKNNSKNKSEINLFQIISQESQCKKDQKNPKVIEIFQNNSKLNSKFKSPNFAKNILNLVSKKIPNSLPTTSLENSSQATWFLITSVWLISLIISWFLSFRNPVFYIRYLSFLSPLTIILTVGGLEILANSKKSTCKLLILGEFWTKPFPNIYNLDFFRLISKPTSKPFSKNSPKTLSFQKFLTVLISFSLVVFNFSWWFGNIQNQNSKNSYRETVAFLQKNEKPNQIILFPNMSSLAGVRHYARLNGWLVKSFLFDKERKEPIWTGTALLENSDYLEIDLTNWEYIWSVYSSKNDNFNKRPSSDFELIQSFQKDSDQKIDLWQRK